jgi:hypothetical protein
VEVCIQIGAEMEKEKINSKDEGGGAQRHKNLVIIALQESKSKMEVTA